MAQTSARKAKSEQRQMVERNGFKIHDPYGPPSSAQLFKIWAILSDHPEAKSPEFPRNKLEASDLITELKEQFPE